MTKRNWYVSTFAQDIFKATQDPKQSEGDGRIYIIRDELGLYYVASGMWSSSQKKAKRFYCGQAAWGAAKKSIYPTYIIIVKK